jgi:hypothetical protein
MKRLSLLVTILAAALAACAGAASAQTTNCVGVLVPGTYANVNVPANALCSVVPSGVQNTLTVTGNVTVESGATLVILDNQLGITFVVNGSLIGAHAANINLVTRPFQTVNILGTVHLTGTTTNVEIGRVSIGGTVSIRDSTGNVSVGGNTVGGSVLVRDNTITGSNGPPAAISILRNAIGGSLVCMDNTPAPIDVGVPNVVGGNKVRQCAGL